jgi:hypothetical protein
MLGCKTASSALAEASSASAMRRRSSAFALRSAAMSAIAVVISTSAPPSMELRVSRNPALLADRKLLIHRPAPLELPPSPAPRTIEESCHRAVVVAAASAHWGAWVSHGALSVVNSPAYLRLPGYSSSPSRSRRLRLLRKQSHAPVRSHNKQSCEYLREEQGNYPRPHAACKSSPASLPSNPITA